MKARLSTSGPGIGLSVGGLLAASCQKLGEWEVVLY